MADSTLKVNILAVDKASGTLGKVGKSFDGMSIAAGAAAAGVAALGLSAIKSASDLNETTSKVGVIFGEAAGAIESFASTAATEIGQSKQQAMDAAATFATFGKSAGLAGDDLATFSTDFVRLSSDMASFSNTSPQEAIEAIGAALRGESEPIRKYGVMLDDATLKQKAFELGLIDTTKEALTPQQKVLAAQKAIFEQTTDAQGDFARTSDGLANKQRILAAELENAKAQLGQNLLPVANTAVSVFADLVGVVGGLPQPLQMTALGATAVGAALVIAVPKIVEAYKALQTLAGASALSRAQLALTAGAAGIAVAALGAVVVGAFQLRDKIDKARQSVEDLNDAWDIGKLDAVRAAYASTSSEYVKLDAATRTLNENTGSLGDQLAAVFTAAKAGAYDILFNKNSLEELAAANRKAFDAVSAFEQPIVDVASKLGVAESAVRKIAETTYDSSMSYLDNKAALENMVRAQMKGTASSGKLAEAQAVLASTAETAEDKLKAYRIELDALDGGALGAQEAQDKLTKAMRDAEKEISKNGGAIGGNSDKAIANRDAVRGLIEVWRENAAATMEATGSQEKANAKLAQGRAAIEEMGRKFGWSRSQVDVYLAALGKLPPEKKTKATFTPDPKAAEYKRKIDKIKKTVFTNARFQTDPESERLMALWIGATQGSPAQARITAEIDNRGGLTGTSKRAAGGPVLPGRRYLVGERGPEVITMSGVGNVTPTGRLGGGTTIVIQAGIGDPRAIAAEVKRVLSAAGARGQVRMA